MGRVNYTVHTLSLVLRRGREADNLHHRYFINTRKFDREYEYTAKSECSRNDVARKVQVIRGRSEGDGESGRKSEYYKAEVQPSPVDR